MEKTPRYVEGNTRDPRNPPDEDLSRRVAKQKPEEKDVDASTNPAP